MKALTSRKELKEKNASAVAEIAPQFGTVITPALRALIDPHDPADPIAAQFLPSPAEGFVHPDELADPISDSAFSPVEGIVHRHADRVLLKPLHACAVHCRFCFRREQIGKPENRLTEATLQKAIDYIAAHDQIWEVILTGGDPFILSDRRLADIAARLNAIPHVKIIRIHTRLPVADPARITPQLIQFLRGRAPVYVLLHCNHPRELTPNAEAAIARLADAGMPLLSQSVLLRGVNDDVGTLTQLMRRFVECRIKPYYLHQTDLARGTAHFRVPIAEGRQLLRQMRALSGLCQPAYILDIPGGHGKVSLNPGSVQDNGGTWILEDYQGRPHAYNEP